MNDRTIDRRHIITGLFGAIVFGDNLRSASAHPKQVKGGGGVGDIAPSLTYRSPDNHLYIDFVWKPRTSSGVVDPSIVVFLGDISDNEKTAAKLTVLNIIGAANFVRMWTYVMSFTPIEFDNTVLQGEPTTGSVGDEIIHRNSVGKLTGSVDTLTSWNVKRTDKATFFLVNGDGRILIRHEGFSELKLSELIYAKHADKVRDGYFVSAESCTFCNGKPIKEVLCASCTGQGKVPCVDCAKGFQIDSLGRSKQCSSCLGTAHVTCKNCRDNSTNFLLQGPNPKGLGVIKYKCKTCDGTGQTWLKKKPVTSLLITK